MKLSELRQLIREEISRILKEETPPTKRVRKKVPSDFKDYVDVLRVARTKNYKDLLWFANGRYYEWVDEEPYGLIFQDEDGNVVELNIHDLEFYEYTPNYIPSGPTTPSKGYTGASWTGD